MHLLDSDSLIEFFYLQGLIRRQRIDAGVGRGVYVLSNHRPPRGHEGLFLEPRYQQRLIPVPAFFVVHAAVGHVTRQWGAIIAVYVRLDSVYHVQLGIVIATVPQVLNRAANGIGPETLNHAAHRRPIFAVHGVNVALAVQRQGKRPDGVGFVTQDVIEILIRAHARRAEYPQLKVDILHGVIEIRAREYLQDYPLHVV